MRTFRGNQSLLRPGDPPRNPLGDPSVDTPVDPKKRSRWAAGFTLIELMVVISIMFLLLSLAVPMYRTSIIRAREGVLHDDLFTLRSLIDQYTLDKQEAPQSLDDLVQAGYLRQLPKDPFTGSTDTWKEDFESSQVMLPTQTTAGIVDVHSGSNLTSLQGEPYNTW